MPIYTGTTKQLGGTENITRKQEFYYGLIQKNVLVTGANGQLGNELRELKKRTNNAFHFIYTDVDELDITSLPQVSDFIEHHSIKYIINCAAYTAVDKAETEPEKAFLINHTGVENLATTAKESGCRLIHISTDYVFDGKATTSYTEETKPNPLSVYGKSKLKGEEAILKIQPDFVIIRTSWLYSEYGTNFVKTMLKLMNEKEEINVVSDQQGSPTYAADLAEMIMVILENSEENEWKSGIYHFSNQGETTWYGFAEKIKELAHIDTCKLRPIKTEEYKVAAERPRYSVLDKSKIESTFHVAIPHWEDALKRCIKKLSYN
jgi:dTDP-4-dehydrorhamnose reductase